jgi:signal peptidase I
MMASSKDEGGFIETVKTVVYALLIAGVFRTLFFQPFWIPSGSMNDTLLVGDFLFVNKMAYGYSAHSCPFSACPISGRLFGSEPERGDVVVFRHPVNGSDFIKRVVGLPGDTVQFRGGTMILNGTPVEVTPDGVFQETFERQGPLGSFPRCDNAPVGDGGICTKGKSIETLPGGRSHSILNIDNSFADTTREFTVEPGHFFFVGDNRDNSQDSRFAQASGGVGQVPFANLIGRADRVMFSSAGRRMVYFWTWRSDRFFKALE